MGRSIVCKHTYMDRGLLQLTDLCYFFIQSEIHIIGFSELRSQRYFTNEKISNFMYSVNVSEKGYRTSTSFTGGQFRVLHL